MNNTVAFPTKILVALGYLAMGWLMLQLQRIAASIDTLFVFIVLGLVYFAAVHRRRHAVPGFVRFHLLQMILGNLMGYLMLMLLGIIMGLLVAVLRLVGVPTLALMQPMAVALFLATFALYAGIAIFGAVSCLFSFPGRLPGVAPHADYWA